MIDVAVSNIDAYIHIHMAVPLATQAATASMFTVGSRSEIKIYMYIAAEYTCFPEPKASRDENENPRPSFYQFYYQWD